MKNIKKFVLLAFVMLAGMNGLEAKKKAGTITNKTVSDGLSVTIYDNNGHVSGSYILNKSIGISNPSNAATVEATLVKPASLHRQNAQTYTLAKTPIGYDGSYYIKYSADGQSLILTFTDGTTIVSPLS